VAKYFRGLGDPTRLRILDLLAEEGELAVGELVERLGQPQATVSTHLGCLRWCGFVATRREQRAVIYRIADERVRALIELAHALLADNAEHVAACTTIDSRC
jgi:DNA-binding transcriptional ArsR family regulator